MVCHEAPDPVAPTKSAVRVVGSGEGLMLECGYYLTAQRSPADAHRFSREARTLRSLRRHVPGILLLRGPWLWN